jgi:hypothetical protein
MVIVFIVALLVFYVLYVIESALKQNQERNK